MKHSRSAQTGPILWRASFLPGGCMLFCFAYSPIRPSRASVIHLEYIIPPVSADVPVFSLPRNTLLSPCLACSLLGSLLLRSSSSSRLVALVFARAPAFPPSFAALPVRIMRVVQYEGGGENSSRRRRGHGGGRASSLPPLRSVDHLEHGNTRRWRQQ